MWTTIPPCPFATRMSPLASSTASAGPAWVRSASDEATSATGAQRMGLPPWRRFRRSPETAYRAGATHGTRSTPPPPVASPAVSERRDGALSRYRICDFTGQLAGAGATRWLAAFGADVIRVEDPVRHGTWDILRSMPPYVDERRGPDFGGGFNNHNVEKRGIALNLRTEKGRELLAEIVKRSDVVAENFAAGVMERLGFGYARLRELRPDVVYVSNCGFGHVGPYAAFKTWGPIVQAVCGLTFTSGLPDREPAGWGYSYM